MPPFLLRRLLWPLIFLLTLFPTLALADPPGRVGRLAHLENEVNFRVDRSPQAEPQAGDTERSAASINWPISSGAILDTDWRGRAEVWIGSTAYRIAGNSEIKFSQLDDERIVLNVAVGSLAVSIMDADQIDDLTVTTPEGNVRFATPGRYRIDVFSDHSEVTTQAGRALIDLRNRPIAVAAGLKARLYEGRLPQIDDDFDQDNFDFWVAERENSTVADAARRYVSPQMTGYQDLDAHGDWRAEPEYGTVWYPRTVADDWAPYRFGRWAWVAPWGWTWIDQATWGFAPFHYGRWVLIQNRWAWSPGRNIGRPVYAPALVGWIGNPGWSVSFSFGSAPAVGWFPLAPREVYVPAYRYSSSYARQINHAHVHDVKMIDRAIKPGARERFTYRNRQQAVTVVPANFLREGRPISRQEWRRPGTQTLERAPQARQAPNQNWLAPAASARRPLPEASFRTETARSNRQTPSAMPQSTPAGTPVDLMRKNPHFDRSTSRESGAPALRRRDAPSSVPRTLGEPAPAAVPAIREERQARPDMPDQKREMRREMREAARMERSTPRESEARPSRQREVAPQIPPQPAPALRPPAPQTQAAPPSAREMPRQDNRNNDRQSRDRPQRRERGDEKEERGPR